MVRSLVLALFICIWGAIAFAVVRALVRMWGFDRRMAGAAAVAVAGALVLGAMSPFALPSPAARPAPAAVPVPVAAAGGGARRVNCPVGATVGPQTLNGSVDDVTIGSRVIARGADAIDVADGTTARLRGWIVGPAGPATELCVIVDGRVAPATITYGYARPDVAVSLAQPADSPSGFQAAVRLPAGTHVVTVGAIEGDRRTVAALNGAPARFHVTHS